MKALKTLLRATTMAAALAVTLPLLPSEPAQALPQDNTCFFFSGCAYCWEFRDGRIIYGYSCTDGSGGGGYWPPLPNP